MRKTAERWLRPELVLLGAVVALILANTNHEFYESIVGYNLFTLPDMFHHHDVTVHFIVNTGLMAIFFLAVGAELRNAFLPGGPLDSLKRASLPVVATLGGIAGPVLVYVVLSNMFAPEIVDGWLVPTATDIAFALIIARMVFGAGHPAVAFLLTLAVVDDGIGLALIPTVYSDGVNWLLLATTIALTVVMTYVMRAAGIHSWKWYLLFAGIPCWLGFLAAGVEPAMGLVPIVLGMPHAHHDRGWFMNSELARKDAISRMEHDLKPFIGMIMLAFGFANSGVQLNSFAIGTSIVLAALIAGKFIGVVSFTFVGMRFGLHLPEGMTPRNVLQVAAIAGIGFTVAIFVASVAFDGPSADPIKLGALLSLPVGALLVFMIPRGDKKPNNLAIDEIEQDISV